MNTGKKYEQWKAITESDFVTLFIKTWFNYIASLRELNPDVKVFTDKGMPRTSPYAGLKGGFIDEIRIIRLCCYLDRTGGGFMLSFAIGAIGTTAILESFAEGAMLGVSVYLASKGVKK